MRTRLCALLSAAAILGVADAAGADAQEYDDVHRCDELAAHPDDPGRWAEGVHDDGIVPGPAIRFCAEAAESHPDTPRFHFQHGRALWAGKRYDEAVEAFLRAEEMNYGPAYAYLGDAYFDGLGGIERDEELAVTLYQMAAEAGFEPAEAVLAEIASLDDEEQVTEQTETPLVSQKSAVAQPFVREEHVGPPAREQPARPVDRMAAMIEDLEHPLDDAAAFDASPFSRGPILSTLYIGDFDRLEREPQDLLIVYLLKLNDYFSEPFNFHSSSCSAYGDPELKPGAMRGLMGSLMGGDVVEQGVEVLRSVGELAVNPLGAMNRVAYIEAEQNAAMKDGVRLAQLYGCASPVFQQLYANLVNYVRGEEPAFASGWPGVRLACIDHAVERGGMEAESKKYCRCVVEQFVGAGIEPGMAEWLRADYDHGQNFATVMGENDALRKQLGACLLQ